MGRIIIVGAGEFGREVDSWISHDTIFARNCMRYFIDDNQLGFKGNHDIESRILGTLDSYAPQSDDRIVLGVSDTNAKVSIVERLAARSIQPETFIHMSVILAQDVWVGEGTVICPGAIVSVGAHIGMYVTINLQSTIGHDAKIGAYSSLMSHVDITGRCSIGQGVYVGSHASVLPGVRVEDRSIIGAGSVVLRRVKEASTVFGVPAKVVAL